MPLFLNQIKYKKVNNNDPEMTRFSIELDEAANFVLET